MAEVPYRWDREAGVSGELPGTRPYRRPGLRAMRREKCSQEAMFRVRNAPLRKTAQSVCRNCAAASQQQLAAIDCRYRRVAAQRSRPRTVKGPDGHNECTGYRADEATWRSPGNAGRECENVTVPLRACQALDQSDISRNPATSFPELRMRAFAQDSCLFPKAVIRQ